jgi:hypothetical protein
MNNQKIGLFAAHVAYLIVKVASLPLALIKAVVPLTPVKSKLPQAR